MASLPLEIITEILTRIPAKLLVRFTIVSKSWYSLIKTPNFIKLHLTKALASNSEGHLILCDKSIFITDLHLLQDNPNHLSFSELHHPLKPDNVVIDGSCNGVLCFSDLFKTNIFLYNPITNTHRKIPVNHIMDFKIRNDRAVYGFGYDSVTEDYKVFSYFQRLGMLEVLYSEIEVFSLKSNSWKSVEGISDLDYFDNHHGVYLNETMYYVVYKEGMELHLKNRFIVKFDFRTDTLLRMECPNYDVKFRDGLLLSLSSLNGCLCLLANYFPDDLFPEVECGEEECPLERADLWMMKEETWVRLFSIRHPLSIGIESMISVVVFSKDGRKLLLNVDESKLGWFDLEDGSFEWITTCGCGRPESLFSTADFFVGSLVSLVDDKLHLEGEPMPKKKVKKRDSDEFLSTRFKLKL